MKKAFLLGILFLSIASFTVYDFYCLNLPAIPYNYAGISFPTDILNNITEMDNMPLTNPTTDHGATLGRVLFYDADLSLNHTISCASCHIQEFAFSDTARFSKGFNGQLTSRNSMGLMHARFQKDGAFFWDNRAATLEIQTLIPFQSPVEMGMPLDSIISRVSAKSFYPQLFQNAFGSSAITSDRIAKALAQFIRSMNTFGSKFRQGVNSAQGNPSIVAFSNFTAEENLGKDLFMDIYRGNCQSCHTRNIMVQQGSQNIGLDLVYADNGVGAATGNSNKNGQFSVPSLINVELTAPYMHDGRFKTLEEVIDFYSDSVKNHPNLSGFMRQILPGNTDPNHVFCDTCPPRRPNYTPAEKRALVAFLKTMTDTLITKDVRWSNPFCCGTYNSENKSACNSYLWHGTVYTSSGTYVFSYPNPNGCISSDTLHLVINSRPAPGVITGNSTLCAGEQSSLISSGNQGGTWYSSNPSVASINSAGIIQAHSPGSSVITYKVSSLSCGNDSSSLNITVSNCQSIVNVKAFIQGNYTGSGEMKSSLVNSGISGAVTGQTDSITIELRSGTDGSLITPPQKTILHSNGTATAIFPIISGSHYIVLKHRNAMETWSAQPVAFGSSVNYDFSTSQDKAFGNNLTRLTNGLYALWSGDINQDGIIESGDYLRMENDIMSILFGYHNTDLTGDGVVESDDYVMMETNIPRIIIVQRPF